MPMVPAPNYTKGELERSLKSAAARYHEMKDALVPARWALSDAFKECVRAGIPEARLAELTGLRPDRVHQMIKDYLDPRSVRV